MDNETDRELGLVKKIIPDMTSFYFTDGGRVECNELSYKQNKINNVSFSTHVSYLKIGVYSMGTNFLIYPDYLSWKLQQCEDKLVSFDPAKNSPVIHTF